MSLECLQAHFPWTRVLDTVAELPYSCIMCYYCYLVVPWPPFTWRIWRRTNRMWKHCPVNGNLWQTINLRKRNPVISLAVSIGGPCKVRQQYNIHQNCRSIRTLKAFFAIVWNFSYRYSSNNRCPYKFFFQKITIAVVQGCFSLNFRNTWYACSNAIAPHVTSANFWQC